MARPTCRRAAEEALPKAPSSAHAPLHAPPSPPPRPRACSTSGTPRRCPIRRRTLPANRRQSRSSAAVLGGCWQVGGCDEASAFSAACCQPSAAQPRWHQCVAPSCTPRQQAGAWLVMQRCPAASPPPTRRLVGRQHLDLKVVHKLARGWDGGARGSGQDRPPSPVWSARLQARPALAASQRGVPPPPLRPATPLPAPHLCQQAEDVEGRVADAPACAEEGALWCTMRGRGGTQAGQRRTRRPAGAWPHPG